ncbi:MAG: PEP-CTERM sorting domain-containing protein [Verrucomicrobiales bacterium]
MRYFQSLMVGLAACGSAHATVTFHSDFDEANLGAIPGLNVDTPNTTGADSGTVSLDTANQTLDLTANAANLWTAREGAPIAWVSAPTVVVGQTWYVETQITHTNSPGGGGTSAGWDQAGITFYSGTPGANPGSENTGTNQSLFAGINDWNAWAHAIQGFADNDPNSSTTGVAANDADDTFEYRIEVTENGASDTYNFFYREDPADVWTSYGPENLSQDFDNTAVGLFLKSNNANATASTEFDYLTVGVIPEPSAGILACLAGFSFLLRRRRK